MPRRARLELPPIPLHITHRGVNRAAVFIDDDDRRHYLDLLLEILPGHAVTLHAYVLMGNHVHLLATAERPGETSAALRNVSQCYVQSLNRKHHRTGTLWEGRFKSCLVSTDAYLLTVYRYIELNAVRAGMCESPEHYPWSSVHANLGLCEDPLVTPHATFVAMGNDRKSRAVAYKTWLHEGIDESQIAAIRLHLAQERALGDWRFQVMVEKTLNRPVTVRARGRPVKNPEQSG